MLNGKLKFNEFPPPWNANLKVSRVFENIAF